MVLPSYVMLALSRPSSKWDDRPRLAAIVGVALSGMEAAALAMAALMAIFSREMSGDRGEDFLRAGP